MSFDANILNVICEHIDDPKTFFNFALVCRKTRYITKLHKNNKMDEFAMEDVSHDCNDNSCVCVERRFRLPNGKLHGVEVCYWTSDDIQFIMHDNGVCLADWNHHKDKGEVIINHYKCECTKNFENSYTNNKIGLNDRSKLLSTCTKSYPYNCSKCGRILKVEEETWRNFEREKLP